MAKRATHADFRNDKFVSVWLGDRLASEGELDHYLNAQFESDFGFAIYPPDGPEYDVVETPRSNVAEAGGTHRPAADDVSQVVEIGRSREARPILLDRFGTGERPILVVGGIHGSEGNSAVCARLLVSYLCSRPTDAAAIPLVVVPEANPDGLERGVRFNARRVDLNRNFPSPNWEKGYASGVKAASEPETQAIVQIVRDLRPRRILSIHSIVGDPCNNYDGPAEALARAMASANGYAVKERIGYPTPGSFGNWAGADLALQSSRSNCPPQRLVPKPGSTTGRQSWHFYESHDTPTLRPSHRRVAWWRWSSRCVVSFPPMKRLFRWAFNGAAALSALLFVATCVLWVRGRTGYDDVAWSYDRYLSDRSAASNQLELTCDRRMWLSVSWGRVGPYNGQLVWGYYVNAEESGGRPRLSFHHGLDNVKPASVFIDADVGGFHDTDVDRGTSGSGPAAVVCRQPVAAKGWGRLPLHSSRGFPLAAGDHTAHATVAVDEPLPQRSSHPRTRSMPLVRLRSQGKPRPLPGMRGDAEADSSPHSFTPCRIDSGYCILGCNWQNGRCLGGTCLELSDINQWDAARAVQSGAVTGSGAAAGVAGLG